MCQFRVFRSECARFQDVEDSVTTVDRRATGMAVGLVLLATSLTGCELTRADAASQPAVPSSSVTTPAVPKASVVTSPTQSTVLRPDATIRLSAKGGLLTTVTAVTADGTAIPGGIATGNLTWSSRGPLPVNNRITVKAASRNSEGVITRQTFTYSTLKPRDTEKVSVSPLSGSVVGVAMPITVHFDYAVTNRAAVERKLVVQATPAVEGSWNWVSSREVQYRPAEYWASGTGVTVTADLRGVEIAKGIWGATRKPVNFQIGQANVNTVDIGNHTLTVKTDGNVLRTIPVTTGKQGMASRQGIKVIMTQENSRRMDAATTGVDKDDPEYYNLVVKYAQRLTYSGEFFHAAPWSEWAQGKQNVSHGCTGMSTENARWFMEHSQLGDPVEFINGSRELEPGNGWTMWNQSYSEWQKGSALK